MSTTISSRPAAVRRWNPVAELKLPRLCDGLFTCAGVKNRTKDPCGWRMERTEVHEIDQMVREISSQDPTATIPLLVTFAELCLCRNHKMQAQVKADDWEKVIYGLKSFVVAGSSISNVDLTSLNASEKANDPPAHENGTLVELPASPVPSKSSKDSWSIEEKFRDLEIRVACIESSRDEGLAGLDSKKRPAHNTGCTGFWSLLLSKAAKRFRLKRNL